MTAQDTAIDVFGVIRRPHKKDIVIRPQSGHFDRCGVVTRRFSSCRRACDSRLPTAEDDQVA